MFQLSTHDFLRFAPAEEINNRILHGDYLIIDTRSIKQYGAHYIPGSIHCPPPFSISDYKKIPSLVWVGIYCVPKDQQKLFSNFKHDMKILISTYTNEQISVNNSSTQQDYEEESDFNEFALHDNEERKRNIDWAFRLYELFISEYNSEHDFVINRIRLFDIDRLLQISPIIWEVPIISNDEQYSVCKIFENCKPPSIIIDDFLYLCSSAEAFNTHICGPFGFIKPTHLLNFSDTPFTSNGENGIEFINIDLTALNLNSSEALVYPTDDLTAAMNISIQFLKSFDTIYNLIESIKREKSIEESSSIKQPKDIIPLISPRKPKIVLFCKTGISRSPTVVIYYIMRALSIPLKEAYEFVKFRRPEVLPNPYCMLQLIKAERQLFRSQSVAFSEVGKMGGLKKYEYLVKTPSTSSLSSHTGSHSNSISSSSSSPSLGNESQDGNSNGLENMVSLSNQKDDDMSPPTNIFCIVQEGCLLM